MKAASILVKAASLVGGERARQHGDAARNYDNVAELWTAWLRIRPEPGDALTNHDALAMMALLKLARTQTGDFNADDYVDAAGYVALAGQIGGEE